MKEINAHRKGDLVRICFEDLASKFKPHDIPCDGQLGIVLRPVKMYSLDPITSNYLKPKPKSYIVLVGGKQQFIVSCYLRKLN